MHLSAHTRVKPVTAITLLTLLVTAAAPLDAVARPNFVIIMIDDLGYADLGCYGNKRNDTPHIDRLANEGLKFTDFHSNGAMCSPTRAALLSGLYQNRFGRDYDRALSARSDADEGLPHEIITIAEALQSAGYSTGMYGKWHLGFHPPNTPIHHGFDDFRGLLTGDGDHHLHINRSGEKDWWHNDAIAMDEGYSTKLLTDYSIGFIQRHRDDPFFLYLAHLAIHFPWQGADEGGHRVEGTGYWNLGKLGPHPPGAVRPVVEAMIESVDRSVGRLIAALRQLNPDRQTLVIFCSDNGGYRHYGGRFRGEISDNGPLRGQKADVWEGGHRVPAIAWWPGRIVGGRVTNETAITMDLMPTLLELADISPSQVDGLRELDGVSLATLLLDGEALPSRTLFWRAGSGYAVRKGPWKLVADRNKSKAELFNLAKDVGERHDLSSHHQELTSQLRAALDDWEREINSGSKAAGSRRQRN